MAYSFDSSLSRQPANRTCFPVTSQALALTPRVAPKVGGRWVGWGRKSGGMQREGQGRANIARAGAGMATIKNDGHVVSVLVQLRNQLAEFPIFDVIDARHPAVIGNQGFVEAVRLAPTFIAPVTRDRCNER